MVREPSTRLERGEPVGATERRIVLEGVSNFRDLGGYQTVDGGQVRWGAVYRADALTFTASGRTAFDQLGLRAVFDLRDHDERSDSPDPVSSIHVPVLSHVEAAGALPARGSAVGHADGEQFLRVVYAALLQHAAPMFGVLFTHLGAGANLPALFHCTGGKDRTGLAAALLLELLGVARNDILDDYELTSRYRLQYRPGTYEGLIRSGMGAEAAAAVFGTPRWTMADTLAELDDVHGGVEAYLTGPGGTSRSTLQRLRASLVI